MNFPLELIMSYIQIWGPTEFGSLSSSDGTSSEKSPLADNLGDLRTSAQHGEAPGVFSELVPSEQRVSPLTYLW